MSLFQTSIRHLSECLQVENLLVYTNRWINRQHANISSSCHWFLDKPPIRNEHDCNTFLLSATTKQRLCPCLSRMQKFNVYLSKTCAKLVATVLLRPMKTRLRNKKVMTLWILMSAPSRLTNQRRQVVQRYANWSIAQQSLSPPQEVMDSPNGKERILPMYRLPNRQSYKNVENPTKP